MKKLLLSMALLMACTFATAQRSVGTWSLIPKVGVNLANISNFDVVITGLSPMRSRMKLSRNQNTAKGLSADWTYSIKR
ncbi:MAG: hypothetical protein ACLTGI_06020 [Hoylesella buccalis]